MPAHSAAGGVKVRRPGGYKMYKEPRRVFGRCKPSLILNERFLERKRAGFPSKLVPKPLLCSTCGQGLSDCLTFGCFAGANDGDVGVFVEDSFEDEDDG